MLDRVIVLETAISQIGANVLSTEVPLEDKLQEILRLATGALFGYGVKR